MFIRQGLACLQPDIVDFSLLAPFRGRDAFSTRAALSQRHVDPIRKSGRPRPARSLLPLSSPFKRQSSVLLEKREKSTQLQFRQWGGVSENACRRAFRVRVVSRCERNSGGH